MDDIRRTKTVVIDAEGRDRGKTFFITEMSAFDAERWGYKAISAMARSGVDIDEDMMDAGIAGLAQVSIRAIATMSFAEADPLMREMMACIQFVPAGTNLRRALVESDVSEVATILLLRDEVLNLHVGFSVRDAISASLAARQARSSLPDMPTSLDQLGPSSPQDSPPSTS
jgi:hypothetical protein